MKIIKELANLYKVCESTLTNKNKTDKDWEEWGKAANKATELEAEFKKMYHKKKKQMEKLHKDIEEMEQFIVDSKMEWD